MALGTAPERGCLGPQSFLTLPPDSNSSSRVQKMAFWITPKRGRPRTAHRILRLGVSATLPLGWTLFEEGGDAFFLVLGGEAEAEEIALVEDALFDR